MPFELETSAWSGEGTFTQLLIDRLREVAGVRFVRVEDAPATRSDADYNFISNELFVGFDTVERREPIKRFGLLPGIARVTDKAMTLQGLEAALAGDRRRRRARLRRRGHAAVPAGRADHPAVSDARLQAGGDGPHLRSRHAERRS